MKQQTAVEWLLNAIETKNGKEFSSYYTEFIEQAKEMEKQQIIDTTTKENIRCTQIANDTLKVLGIEPLFMVDDTWGKHYYNNTFKNK